MSSYTAGLHLTLTSEGDMGQLSKVLRNVEVDGLAFWCAGCQQRHMIRYGHGSGPRWTWNGDVDKPVISPSILVTGRDFTPKGEADYEAWHAAGCQSPAPEFESADIVCHTFVGCNGAQPGQIIYLSDCTHALAGQTIDLPEMPGHSD